ncbi:MAG: DedA family protein [Clostridium sp.]
MQAFVIEVMSSFGYVGIFTLILVENLFPPIPSEVILTFGGFMTTYTTMNTTGVILASTFGSVCGAVILYYTGRLIPQSTLEKWFHFDGNDIEDAMKWFDSKGKMAVLVCRCIPIVRSLISIPAGLANMKMAPFLILTTIGSLIWNTVLVSAGAAAGVSWERVLELMHHYSGITLVVVGVAALVGSCLYFRK